MDNYLEDKGIETKIIHYGHQIDPATGALASPIYQTATFGYETVEGFEDACCNNGYVYSRELNPTTTELEKKLAMLEGAESAVVASSGMGAICSTLLTLLSSGDHVICAEGVFSHTNRFMKELLLKFCVEISFVNAVDVENIRNSIRPNTKVIFVETPLNPSLNLIDITRTAKVAHERGILLIVDGTFAPPPIQQAIKLGADISIHSLTKYINGHGDALGGVVAGPKEIIDKIRFPGMPCFTGASLTPFNAWLILRGMKTLAMRVRKHSNSAMKIAKFLKNHTCIKNVIYPGLESHPQHNLFITQMNEMGGGIISFNLKENAKGVPAKEHAKMLLNKLEICTIATSLGEEHTLVQIENSGLIRISVGLEDAEDIIEDLNQALEAICKLD